MPETKRAEYIKGLRLLANLLAEHDDLTLPYYGSRCREQTLYIEGSSPVTQALLYIQAMDETPAMKFEWQSDRLTWLAITGRMGGLHAQLRLRAQETCEYRVTGVHKASDGSMHEVKEWTIPAALQPAEQAATVTV